MAARLHYDDHEYKTPKYYNFTENVESATRLPKDDSKARNYTTKSSPDPNFTFKQERIWAQGLRDVKLCVIDNGQQVVLLGRMPYDEEDEMRGKQVIQVRDAMSGGITSQWESQCQHSFSIRLRLASWRSNNTPYLAHSCPVCEAVDVYDVSRKQLITKYEEDDMSPGAICRGPGTDTLLLVDGKGKRIQQLQWRGDSFQPIRPIQHNHPDRYPCISYSSLHGNIYLAGQYTVSCISLLEGQSGHPLWQLGGLGVDVGEQQLDSTMSVCCDPAGRVYISECNRDRLLVVDGETGELRHVQSGMIPRPGELIYTGDYLLLEAGDNVIFYKVHKIEMTCTDRTTEEEFILKHIEEYQQACVDGEAFVREAKLIVLGGPGDGKTSLVNRLIGKAFPQEHIPTNAIDTSSCMVDVRRCYENWEVSSEPEDRPNQRAIISTLGQSLLLQKLNKGIQNTSGNNEIDLTLHYSEKSNHLQAIGPEISEHERETHNASLVIIKAGAKANLHEEMGNRDIIDEETADIITKEEEANDCKLEILDFGGQVIFCILHSIFMSSKCVYALVVNLSIDLNSLVSNGSTYMEQIEFWLNMILSRRSKQKYSAEPDNVIIVGTHKDLLDNSVEIQERKAYDYFEQIQNKLTNKAHLNLIKDFIPVDNKNRATKSFERLRSIIIETAKEHCCWNDIRPIKWLKLEERLKRLKEGQDTGYFHLITFDQFKEYGSELAMNEKQLKLFLDFYCLKGDLICHPSTAMKMFQICDPKWLICIFRQLITLQSNHPRGPKFRQEVIQLHWSFLRGLAFHFHN